MSHILAILKLLINHGSIGVYIDLIGHLKSINDRE